MSQSTKGKTNPHLLPLQEQWINMSVKEIKHLFAYYIIALILSLLWILFSILYHYELSENGFSNMVGLFMFSFPSGVLGAIIYYIRKLYKSCIQNIVIDNSTDASPEIKLRKIGAKMYFYLRPLISGVLAILASIAVVTGVFIVNNQPGINNENFFLFSILLSFYIGFCNGKLIIKLEEQGNDIINYMLKEKKHGQ